MRCSHLSIYGNIVKISRSVNFMDMKFIIGEWEMGIHILSDSKRISIFKLIGTPPVVEHTVFISDNFHVEAYRRQSKILTRDIINAFSNTVTKYSQIDHIINRLKVASVDISSEIRTTFSRQRTTFSRHI